MSVTLNVIAELRTYLLPVVLVSGIYFSYRGIVYRGIRFFRYTLCFFILSLLASFSGMWVRYTVQSGGSIVSTGPAIMLGAILRFLALGALVYGCYYAPVRRQSDASHL